MTHILPKDIVYKIGEDLPLNCEFNNITNLNNLHSNFPLFDFIAKRNSDGKNILFSAKGRNIYSKNGEYNKSYNILTKNKKDINSYITTSRKINSSLEILARYGYDINNIELAFIICPIEFAKDIYYYWGYFSDINPNINIENMMNGKCGFLCVSTVPDKLKTYKIFGIKSWEEIKMKYL